MADRISQLQFKINELADHMCNAIGVLQQSSRAIVDNGPNSEAIEKQNGKGVY